MGKLVTYESRMKCSEAGTDKAYSLLLEDAARLLLWMTRAGVKVEAVEQAEFFRHGAEGKKQTVGYRLVCEVDSQP